MGAKSSRYKKLPPEAQKAWKRSKFTVKEIEAFYNDFKKRYPQGYLTLADFKQMYKEIAGPDGDSDEFATYVFRLYDTKQSGSLSFGEFIHGMSQSSYQNPAERASWIFKLYDLNGDGVISLEEMVQVLKAIFKLDPKPTLNLSLKLPLGLDELSPEKIAEKVFEKYDTNKDGRLELKELQKSVENDPFLAKLFA